MDLRDVGQLLRTRPAPVAPEKRENVRRSKPAREQFAEKVPAVLGMWRKKSERSPSVCMLSGASALHASAGAARFARGRGLSAGRLRRGRPVLSERTALGRVEGLTAFAGRARHHRQDDVDQLLDAGRDRLCLRTEDDLGRRWRLVPVRHPRDAGDSAVVAAAYRPFGSRAAQTLTGVSRSTSTNGIAGALRAINSRAYSQSLR